MEFTIDHPSSDVLVVALLDHNVYELTDHFRQTVDDSNKKLVELDLSAVESICASAIGTLLGIQRQLHMQGGRLTLVNVQQKVMELLHLTRMDRVFSIQRSELVSSSQTEGGRISSMGRYAQRELASSQTSDEPDVNTFSITANDRRFAADFQFAAEQLAIGAFEIYAGHFVGIYQRQVVAIGDRETDVRRDFELKQGISGTQLAVKWIAGDEIR